MVRIYYIVKLIANFGPNWGPNTDVTGAIYRNNEKFVIVQGKILTRVLNSKLAVELQSALLNKSKKSCFKSAC